MKKEKQFCISYYEEAAQGYDSGRFSCQCQKLIDRIFKKTVYGFIKDKEKILDAGTGTGRFARYFAKRSKKIIAMDASQAMLKEAEKKAKEEKIEENIDFISGDIEKIPLKNNSVDAITCIHVLVHYKNIEKAISEFSRILKPGGSLVFEVADSRLSKHYNKLRHFLTGQKYYSYPDYYHAYKDIISVMNNNNFSIYKKRRIKKIPRFIMHLLLCKCNFNFLKNFIEWLEKYNFGHVSIINWKKIK
jgi:ubiquinone/menaquinone biosynthesis C-methylase UbiE